MDLWLLCKKFNTIYNVYAAREAYIAALLTSEFGLIQDRLHEGGRQKSPTKNIQARFFLKKFLYSAFHGARVGQVDFE